MTIAPEAINTARDCQKVRLPAKKARYNTMKASQPKTATTVPATLAATLFMVLDFSFAKLIRLLRVDSVDSWGLMSKEG